MISKKEILDNIQSMPETEFETLDVLFERLILLQKIKAGIDDVENGRSYSLEELKKELGV